MKANRRFLAMGFAAVALILLGFVVAVAARTRPGGIEEDIFLDMRVDLAFDLTKILAWVIVVMAIAGVALFALGVREKPRQEKKKRNFLAIALAAVLLVLIFRYVQPLAVDLFQGADPAQTSQERLEDAAAPSGGGSAWLFSILLAAIVVAALTRVGLTVRAMEGGFDLAASEESASISETWGQPPLAITLGFDPRSRVLNAYARFERAAAARGVDRQRTETARRHARRVIDELGVSRGDASALIDTFALTRFGRGEIGAADADAAELLSAKLCGEMGS